MRTAYELVSEELQCAFGRAKIRYDSRVKAIRFEVGQYVLYTNPAAKPQLTQKWILQTTGPHLIVQKLNVNYRIQLQPAGRVMTVHIDRLVRYEGEISAEWRRFAERLFLADTQGSSNPVVTGPPAGNSFPTAEASAPAGNSFAASEHSSGAELDINAPAGNPFPAAATAARPQHQHRPPARYQQLSTANRVNSWPTAKPPSDTFPAARPDFQLGLGSANSIGHSGWEAGYAKVVDKTNHHFVSSEVSGSHKSYSKSR